MIASVQTLDRAVDLLNEAQFFASGSGSERAAVACIIERQGGAGAYRGGFALTPRERSDGIRVFTGELMTSASARHIIGEECCRVLRKLARPSAQAVAALGAADAAMAAHILPHVDASKRPGVFCCGKCTVAFWRNLLSGGFNNQQARLAHGVQFLRARRDGKGGWHRFPFHYTVLALGEMKADIARDEIAYVAPVIKRRLKRKPARDKYALRRHEAMTRALAAI